MTVRPRPARIDFVMNGRMQPLIKAVAADAYVPTRPMGGWLASYAAIGPNGGLVPVGDRQGHMFEAAQALGQIDFTGYLAKGLWNDTHSGTPANPVPRVVVGVPTSLEFHDETSPLAKAHGKTGWWTEGHLLDPGDPRSWLGFTAYEPTSKDLERSDYFWGLATLLKGTPRDLGISSQGQMLTSPCGKRIIWAQINAAAVCEVPQSPLTTLQPLTMGTPLKLDMIGASPCNSCSCPPGACRGMRLTKAVTANNAGPLVGEDLEGVSRGGQTPAGVDAQVKIERLVALLQERHKVTRPQALRWVHRWLASKQQQPTKEGDDAR